MVLDRAFGSPDLARAEASIRMKVTVIDVSIREVDYVRETTRVAVRYLVETPRRERRTSTAPAYGRVPHPQVSAPAATPPPGLPRFDRDLSSFLDDRA
jgi:hypothetical protein